MVDLLGFLARTFQDHTALIFCEIAVSKPPLKGLKCVTGPNGETVATNGNSKFSDEIFNGYSMVRINVPAYSEVYLLETKSCKDFHGL
jgi:hypothetical protein